MELAIYFANAHDLADARALFEAERDRIASGLAPTNHDGHGAVNRELWLAWLGDMLRQFDDQIDNANEEQREAERNDRPRCEIGPDGVGYVGSAIND